MRIPNMKTKCLPASDLSPMFSPKLNAHKQGCPRTMCKRQITNGSCCEYIQQNTESLRHHIYSQCAVIYAYALYNKERDWEEANITASSSQSLFCICYKGDCKLHYQEKGRRNLCFKILS